MQFSYWRNLCESHNRFSGEILAGVHGFPEEDRLNHQDDECNSKQVQEPNRASADDHNKKRDSEERI